MDLRNILRSPLIYQSYQIAGGFFNARLKAIRSYLPLNDGDHVIDIGCGPGFLVEHIPHGVLYTGFDTDSKYIEFANARFKSRGTFVCDFFNEDAARKCRPANVVMMNGVLHHLDDMEVSHTLSTIKNALAPGGVLFTLDGCFIRGQSPIARALLNSDRGKFVRNPEQYRSLLLGRFQKVDVHISHDLSWMPYTWIVMIGRS